MLAFWVGLMVGYALGIMVSCIMQISRVRRLPKRDDYWDTYKCEVEREKTNNAAEM